MSDLTDREDAAIWHAAAQRAIDELTPARLEPDHISHAHAAFVWALRQDALMMTAQLDRLPGPALREVVYAAGFLHATAAHLRDMKGQS